MSEKKVFTAGKIFNGTEIVEKQYVSVENGTITSLSPVKPEGEITDLGQEALLAPALMDVQLYGAYGHLLCNEPNAASVQAIYDYSRAGGAAYILPTMATNTFEVYCKAIDAIRDYWRQGGKGVLGIHIEGSWFHPAKHGCHPLELLFQPTLDDAKRLLDYGKGVIKMVTLAPEMVSDEVINYIHSQGVIVSAGHSNATYEEATAKFNNCHIRTSTHLFNAMSSMMHRAPGLIGAIFDHPAIMASIIPDGYHVDFAVVRIAKKLMGKRLFVITDAQTETSEGYYPNYRVGDKYMANGTLSGSALTMAGSVKKLVDHCGIAVEEALRMCSLYPAEVMRMDDRFGKIAEGYEAKFVVFVPGLAVTETID